MGANQSAVSLGNVSENGLGNGSGNDLGNGLGRLLRECWFRRGFGEDLRECLR